MVVGALPETFALDDRPVCWLSLGSTIYLGTPLDLGGHARMVGALILGVSGPLTMTTDGQSVRSRSVFIPAQAVTEIVEVPERVAVCTFDPTATRVASCTDGMRATGNGLYTGHRDIWNENVTRYLRTDRRCPFSKWMSHPRSLSCADDDVLTRCHARFFSKLCHFSDLRG